MVWELSTSLYTKDRAVVKGHWHGQKCEHGVSGSIPLAGTCSRSLTLYSGLLYVYSKATREQHQGLEKELLEYLVSFKLKGI